MHVGTGHLVSDLQMVPEEQRKEYVRVPSWAQADAKRALGDKSETYVSVAERSVIANFRRKKLQKQRTAAKIAKQSRIANRKKD